MTAVVADDSAVRRAGRRFQRPAWPVLVGGGVVALLVMAALLTPLIAPYGPNQLDFANTLSPPSLNHLMGTDDTGRDVFSRTLYGLRIDLVVVVAVTYIPLPVGVLVGAVAGYYGGVADLLLSRVVDIMLAFPAIGAIYWSDCRARRMGWQARRREAYGGDSRA